MSGSRGPGGKWFWARTGSGHLLVAAVGCLLVVQGCGPVSGGLDDQPSDPMVTASSAPSPAESRSATMALPTSGPAPAKAANAPTTSTTGNAAMTSTTTTSATIAPTTTTLAEDLMTAEELLDLVKAHYEALNQGTISIRGVGSDQRRAVALNARFDADCRIDGTGVVCTERVFDDFYGPAGISFVNDVTFVSRGADALLVSHADSCFAATGHAFEPKGQVLQYLQGFDRWLHETHPDTVRWIWLFAGEGLPNWVDGRPCQLYSIEGTAPDPRLVEFVREFVAQSEDYPLEPRSSSPVVPDFPGPRLQAGPGEPPDDVVMSV